MEGYSDNKDLPTRQTVDKENKNLPGYPLYPDNEDIYTKSKNERDLNPENVSGILESNENNDIQKISNDDFSGNNYGTDLDIPGSELDDKQEDIGNEDEENNYYSLGGDDHNDLDENLEK